MTANRYRISAALERPSALLYFFTKGAAIASNTFIESIRQPIYGIILGLAVLMILISPYITMFTLQQSPKLIVDMGLATIMLAGLLLAAFTASNVISAEIENRTVLTVISKPVGRGVFILGKFIGVIAGLVMATYLLALTLSLTSSSGAMEAEYGQQTSMAAALSLLGAMVIAAFYGIYCNFFKDKPFMSRTIGLLIPLFTLLFLVFCFVEPPGPQTGALRFDRQYAPGWRESHGAVGHSCAGGSGDCRFDAPDGGGQHDGLFRRVPAGAAVRLSIPFGQPVGSNDLYHALGHLGIGRDRRHHHHCQPGEGWLDTYARGVQRRRERAAHGDHAGTLDTAYGVGTTEYMRARGGYGVTLECGQHDDPAAPDVGYRAIRQTLALLGLAPIALQEPGAGFQVLRLVDVVDRDHQADQFVGPWKSFDPVSAGQAIGRRHDGSIVRAPADGFVVFPNPNALVGNEWFYFAQTSPRTLSTARGRHRAA